MRILKGLALGSLQGLTEFLPVSSSGHLILLESFGMGPDLSLNLFLHVSTLLAVGIALRKDIWGMIKKPFGKVPVWIIIASVPTAIVAVLFKKFLPTLLEGALLAPSFMLTAVLLLLPTAKKQRELSWKNSLFVGFCQGLAVLPGISRSGATITAMRLSGIEEKNQTKLSFLLSFPVIIGGAAVEIPSVNFDNFDLYVFIPALLSAFFVGLVALKVMLKAYSSRSALPFSIYLFALSVFTLVWHG